MDYAKITAVVGLKEAAIDTLENTVCGMETESTKGFVEYTGLDGKTVKLDLSHQKCIPFYPSVH